MAEKILAAPKMVSFSHLPAVKKKTFLVQLEKIFGPSYFVTAPALSKSPISEVSQKVQFPFALKLVNPCK